MPLNDVPFLQSHDRRVQLSRIFANRAPIGADPTCINSTRQRRALTTVKRISEGEAGDGTARDICRTIGLMVKPMRGIAERSTSGCEPYERRGLNALRADERLVPVSDADLKAAQRGAKRLFCCEAPDASLARS